MSVVSAGFEPMIFLRQACAAIVLVMLTLACRVPGWRVSSSGLNLILPEARKRSAPGVPPCSWCGSPA